MGLYGDSTMVHVCLPNRNRPNWLWAFLSVVVLLPLMLGQSSAGGCGAAVTVPNSNSNAGPNGNLNETLVDSDGDGFSDDVEINGTPGTDPNDPTDNPNNVRDSDGDGCSDYDELTRPNSCDNDPNTPLTVCDTTYYNAEYRYGFDLPTDSIDGGDEDKGMLFSHHWTHTISGNVLVLIGTWVNDDPLQSLEGWVNGENQLEEASGSKIEDAFPYSLGDGRDGYLTVLIQNTGLVAYRLDSNKGRLVYTVLALIDGADYTDYAHNFIMSVLDSLCIE
jgi:hypothetical protein